MLYSGLVSVTFRELKPEEIVKLSSKAGIDGIEWGGDIHVPHGELGKAREVGGMTVNEGLKVISYGSYYRAGCSPAEGLEFEKVLESALELGAPHIRVWAGRKGSGQADDCYWKTVAEDTQRICSMSEKAGIKVSFEYHANTLTDTKTSAVRLVNTINCRNLYLYWQPSIGLQPDTRLEDLLDVKQYLSNLHVYQWNGTDKLPLAEGADEWRKYFDAVKSDGKDHSCLLEFVRNNDPAQFLADAKTLKEMLLSCCKE